MAAAATISGGTSTLGSTGDFCVFSFALKEIGGAVVMPPRRQNIRTAVNRAASW
jgi:hypothetical protein